MARMTGGEAIVQALIDHGIDTIFGLPGVQNDALYSALYDARKHIRLIHTRHEQGAAYMALGAALSTGMPSVYNVVPGPGFLNTTAALATAYSTNARVMCLTGQIASASIGRGHGLLHEIPDQLGILRSLTKWAARITSPAEAPMFVAEAFRQLHNGRPRPVGLEVPPDVLAARAELEHIKNSGPSVQRMPVDSHALSEAAKLLAHAKQPMIFVGSGAIAAADSIIRLAELLQAPVVSSRSGHGIMSSNHHLALRLPEAHSLWPDVDVVLAIGSRLQTPLLNWGSDSRLKVIRIDVDPTEHIRIAAPHISFISHAEDVLPELVSLLEQTTAPRDSRKQEMDSIKAGLAERAAFLEPQLGFVRAIRAALPEDGFFVDEMTQVGYVARFAFPIYQPRTFISTGYQGTLGWGFAAALGVKAAHPDRAVVSVSGDGGFMFNVQELATAVQHGIASISIIFNDNAFGNVRRTQKEDYDNRIIASELHNPDFMKLAEAFGATGMRVHTADELQDAIHAALPNQGPTLIEVPVEEMPSPWPVSFLPRVRQ